MTLTITKKRKDERKHAKNWVETGDRLTARISAECHVNQGYIQKVVTKILEKNPSFDWEQDPDWKSICEEVSDHPTEDAFLEALQRDTGVDALATMQLHSISLIPRAKEAQLDDMLRQDCGMADLLKLIYEGDPDKHFDRKNKKDVAMMKEKALARLDLLQYVKQGHCGNGKLKHYVDDLMLKSVMTPDDVDDTLREMEGDISLSGEVERGYIRELGGFRFPKAKRVKELIRLLGDRYKLEFVEVPEEGVTLAVFKPRASGQSEVSAKEIRENEGLFVTPEGEMSMIGETSPYVEGEYTGPQPPRDITRELKSIPHKIVLRGKPLARQTIKKAEAYAKKGLKGTGKFVLRGMKEWWTGEPTKPSKTRRESETDEMLHDLRKQVQAGKLSPYQYQIMKEELKEEAD